MGGDQPEDTIDHMFELAATSTDDDVRWAAVEQLRALASDEIVARAVRWCQSEDWREREAGVDVLAQIGLPAATYHETVMQCLLAMLAREEEPTVLRSLALACGHRRDRRAREQLCQLATHADADVRYAVVHGLLGDDDERAVTALIQLSQDSDDSTRDWATFGLGTQLDADTPAIRAALLARLDDAGGETAGEAAVGLARRRDGRVLLPLQAMLADGLPGSLPLEAAMLLGDAALLPSLKAVQSRWDDRKDWRYQMVLEAIAVCTPVDDEASSD